MNIYTKLTALCLFLVITSSVALIFFSNQQFQNQFRQEIISSLQEQSIVSSGRLNTFLEDRLNELSFAAKLPVIQNGSTGSDLQTELDGLKSFNASYLGFSLHESNGQVIQSGESGNSDVPNTLWDLLGQGNDQAILISRSGNNTILVNLAVKANSDYGTILLGQVDAGQVFSELTTGAHQEAISLYLVDEKGLILYASGASERSLNESFDNFSLIKDQGQTAGDLVEEGDRLFLVSKQNLASMNNWSLIFEVDRAAVLSPLQSIRSSLVWVVLTILIAVALLALVAANVFVKPIVKLSQAAEQIGDGNLDVRVDIQSKDELGKLGDQLNSMAERLNSILNEEKDLNSQLGSQASELEDQKNELEAAHAQITSSLDYAQRIQSSMLPTNSELRRNVNDSFIFFRPKDVVSGDFYWFEKVRRGRNEYLILAAADCTGHGVPGAIMSMMGGNQLTNIIYYQNYIEPEKILARLDKAIKFELYRDEQVTVRRDGMEIMICVIDLDSLEMKYAGAGMPLMRLGKEGEMETLKSPKLMIGGVEGDDEKEVEEQFSLETMQLEEGDKLFLSSDGFQDQFGGPDDKRYMARNLRRFIERSRDMKMKDLGTRVEEEFDRWKGESDQTDDVLVIGVEI